MKSYLEISSPMGAIGLWSDAQVLSRLAFLGRDPLEAKMKTDNDLLAAASRQLAEYFDGRRRAFDLPLGPQGTEFQCDVWRALREIPYGQTISYRDLARAIGRPGAMRAVGGANGANPLPILIPCHRVIAADGGWGGFSAGLAVKRLLLSLEGVAVSARWPDAAFANGSA